MTDKVYEKLGVFYLGRRHDLKQGRTLNEPLLYDSKDLTTHAMVVGMTGSGKTGLCIDLLEEAGIDGIPALVIDPKGDIANLLLQFPDLRPEDFLPWVEPAEASRHGMSPLEFARKEADKWRNGLASWDQDPVRMQTFRQNVDLTIYTPGSNAGRPLTILKSFSAPPTEVLSDSEAFRDRITSAVSGLLGLLGIDADPIRSREHILISKILETVWTAGRDLNLGQLIMEIQNPPFQRVGIIDLEGFYPSKDRMELAMALNNLLASPSFSSWMSGEPLNVKNLLYTEAGQPRISIVSIAHLNEAERMFFVTLLLNEVLAWTRTQSGTSSLRALLYMDEVFGYFPPVANPPSKQPMLMLLKQARAFGLGVVLATQNPVDLDYKGLSNIGTWFLGRLQTERDKQRVLEGLEGAAAVNGTTFSHAEMEQTLAGLGTRRFLMNNVHEDGPVIFETRWALSYLRGPLTRRQLQELNSQWVSDEPANTDDSGNQKPDEVLSPAALAGTDALVLPTGIKPRYMVATGLPAAGQRLIYRPALVGVGRLHFAKASSKVDHWEQRTFLVKLGTEVPVDPWTESIVLPAADLEEQPSGGEFAALPAAVSNAKNFELWKKQFQSFLYRDQTLKIFKCRELKLYSEPGESEGDFRIRLKQQLAEQRDLEKEKLRQKFNSKFSTLDGKIRRAEDRIEREKNQYSQRKWDSVLSLGTTVLGALMGRKKVSVTNMRRAGSSMKSMSKIAAERTDVKNAEENLEVLVEEKESLEAEFQKALEELDSMLQASTIELEEQEITPRKSDLTTVSLDLVWLPFQVDSTGIAEPLFG